MDETDYPALYLAADGAALREQRRYLSLIASQYALLLCAAIFAIDFSDTPLYYAVYSFIFFLSTIALFYLATSKPEQGWYKCRALAESIKTATWRYMMRAAPFAAIDDSSGFQNFLREILEANRHIGERISGLSAEGEQVTARMASIRQQALNCRKRLYGEQRIQEQKSWYSNKAISNKRSFRMWIGIVCLVYAGSMASVLLRIVFPDIRYWPTEPLIVLASSIIGWIQIKKFNELASAYTLTAHEIGIIQSQLSGASDEASFSDFVNEAELAFSREHTQWVARQDAA